GLINGIYVMGTIGTAVTTFASPVIVQQFGWEITVHFDLVLLLLFVVMTFFLGDVDQTEEMTMLGAQLSCVYKHEKLWFFSLFYFITFGSFVAFTVFLPSFLVDFFALDKVDAGFRTAGFIVIATLVRPVGGWLADKFESLFILMACFLGLT